LYAQELSLHNNNTPWPIPLPKAGTTINLILKDLPTSANLKCNLSKHGFQFIEQFTNYSNTRLLTRKQTHHSIKKILRKHIPGWFTRINDEIVVAEELLNTLVTPNPF